MEESKINTFISFILFRIAIISQEKRTISTKIDLWKIVKFTRGVRARWVILGYGAVMERLWAVKLWLWSFMEFPESPITNPIRIFSYSVPINRAENNLINF